MFCRHVMRVAAATIGFLAGWIMVCSQASGISEPRWGANYFPNVPLTTQDGKTVRFYDDLLKNKIVAIDLIYTHCVDSCPLETARLAQVQKMLEGRVGRDIFFYSISIDPKRDTPPVLKRYAEQYHAGPGWLFLTGKPSDIELISKKLGLYSDPDSGNRDGHTTQLLIGNVATGQWMQNSATDNPRFLATTLSNFIDAWKKPGAPPAVTYAAAPTLDADSGRYLFATRCAACHTIGHGTRIGPDLLGITSVRDHTWLARFIQKPDLLLAEKDPLAVLLYKRYNQIQMPNLRLGPQDTERVIDFLASQSIAAQKPGAADSLPSRSHGTSAAPN
jgi:protein SCO1